MSNINFRIEVQDGDNSLQKIGNLALADVQGWMKLTIPLTSSQANEEIAMAFTVASLRALVIYSPTLSVTLETNDATTPDFAWTCPAGGIVVWTEGMATGGGLVKPIADAVTTAFLTNNTAAAGTAYVFYAIDATP